MDNNTSDLVACRTTYLDGKLYFLARDFNLLFSIDPKDGTMALLDAIPEENPMTRYLCGAMNAWNDKLILTPFHTRMIWIYDLISKDWDSLAIKEYEHCKNGGFFQTYIYENKMFLIGGNYPAILCLNLEDNSCEYIEKPYKELITRNPDAGAKPAYFRKHGVRLKDTLYLVSCLDSFVLKFDMNTRKHRWIGVGNENNGYSEIAWDGKYFWLSPLPGGDIVKWDGNEEIKILPLPAEWKESPKMHTWEACFDGKQIIFPCATHPKSSILIDTQNDTFQFCDPQYALFTELDNGMIVSQTTEGVLSVSTKDTPPKTWHIAVEAEQLIKFFQEKNLEIFDAPTLYYEGPKHSINALENFVTLANSEYENPPAADGQIGKAIWDVLSTTRQSE